MRVLSLLIVAACAGLGGAGASAEEARTTRIVTEPVHGAIVSVEHGVNVYRPVPPTTHLIVNADDGATVIVGARGRRIFANAPSDNTAAAGR